MADRSPIHSPGRSRRQLPQWRRNVLRLGYLVMAAGIAVTKWPLLVDHATWELKEGTVICMLVAMSVLGLRYPVRMVPLLLFEVAWKLLWLGVVALPQWSAGRLDAATTEQANAVLWVVVIIAVVPWRFVLGEYVKAPGEPWRTRRS